MEKGIDEFVPSSPVFFILTVTQPGVGDRNKSPSKKEIENDNATRKILSFPKFRP